MSTTYASRCDQSPLSNPRRVTLGLEQNRLAMLLAVLHRHGGVGVFCQRLERAAHELAAFMSRDDTLPHFGERSEQLLQFDAKFAGHAGFRAMKRLK